MLVPLAEATDEAAFGGKAVSLGRAIRAGLPVPPGIALSSRFVDRIAAGDAEAVKAVLSSPDLPRARLAVRSSAIAQDSRGSSFPGQHATCLNVAPPGIPEAVYVVWESARISGEPAIGAVIQRLIDPVVAGVLFTRNPMTGADERLIEAAWGLGEAVVSGVVTPDRYRLDSRGRVIERVIGVKDVRIAYNDEEGTSEQPVREDLQEAPCLDDLHLDQLHALAERCRALWKTELDLEWAIEASGAVYLVQSRPTR